MGAYDGTVTSKLKPIVTTLTEELVKDFELVYRHVNPADYVHPLLFERTDETGDKKVVTTEQLYKDVETWLLNLEEDMAEESDKQYAQMVIQMVRKNPGWVTLLTNRLIRRLTA